MATTINQNLAPLADHRDDQPTSFGRSLTFWTRTTLIWLMAITVTGALVRLTGSGLGCLDWPTCTSNTELDEPAFHATIEFGNRVISGLAILPVIAAWIAARSDARRELTPWFIAMVIGFFGQVVLGMLVVRAHLEPEFVIGHFLLSIVLIFFGVVLDHRARLRVTDEPIADSSMAGLLGRIRHVRFLFLAASAVVFVGTLVTGSGPHTGSETTGEPIPRLGFDIRNITRIHSLLGWLLVAVIVVGLVQGRRTNHRWASHDQQWMTRIGALAILQGGVGYLQFAIGVPVGLVALHIGIAVLLWTAICWYTLTAIYPLRHTVKSP